VALRNKEREVADVVEGSRALSARARANIYFLGQLPRFALESGIIGGFVVVGGAGYLLGGVGNALTAVALFGLAGFRMAPSVTRFQSVTSQMIAVSMYPRRVLDELRESEHGIAAVSGRPERQLPRNPGRISFDDVSLRYGPEAPPALRHITLEIPFGSSAAFVGASGSGKSTMVDLLLSLLEPSEGAVSIDGVPLIELTHAWRDRVGYVPQDVALFDSTIGQNVALTWGTEYDRERARASLEQAQLWDLVASKEGGLDAPVGERGMALSGGQRQRLGIARALYSDPLVLVMDEATSALDTHTESQVALAIDALPGSVTKVVVAHRLATIKHFDRIFFMRDGELAGSGSFDELVRRFPDFALQAELAGLA
jgi:ATP-binding cassette subfamily C protein